MLRRIQGPIAFAWALTLFGGCAPIDERGEYLEAADELEELSVDGTAVAVVGPSAFFSSYTYRSTNGVPEVERFAECGADQVLTGFGARVAHGNVRDLTVYCRRILANGSLEAARPTSAGGKSQEKVLHADKGQVVVGAGAIVTRDNVKRLVLRQCPWVASTKRLDVSRCSDRSTDRGATTSEAFLNLHDNFSARDKPKVVAVGVGFTSSGDDVYAVRMTVGMLE